MRGFTVIETTVAVAIFAIAILIIGGMFDTSSRSLTYFSNVGSADTTLRRTLDGIAEEIHQAQASSIAIVPSVDQDMISFTRALGETETASVTYMVNGARELVRTQILPGPITASDVVARQVDVLDAAKGKGFSLARLGTSNLYTVSLRVNVNLHGGKVMARSFATTVGTRF